MKLLQPLPDMSLGCHNGTDETRDLPVIMLTARTDEEDITAGLDAGADDYVTKPFSPRVLNSRIKALLRRSQALGQSDAALKVGPISLDAETHRVSINNQPLELGHTEFKLLRFFMATANAAKMLETVRGAGYRLTTKIP